MRTFSIYTLGCKVNQYEGQQIREFLEGLGLSAVEPAAKPDLFVINTCCVTSTASAKSRQYIQRAGKVNPDATRVVCGCLSAISGLEFTPSGNNNVHIISSRDNLPAMLTQIVIGEHPPIRAKNNAKIKNDMAGSAKFPKLPRLTSFKGHTRAFLKVQDGCDGLCSYCIVPKVRPNVQSKPIDEAVAEAKALVASGHKEIVVTGVNLGAYGRSTTKKANISDCGFRIADLLKELANIEGLARIRVSSLEPGDITEELLDVFCANKNIMPHIHLSVQSGSEQILKRMCRPYGADQLREKISLIKGRLDRPAITSDIIVGFPTETEEDFQATVELARWAGFSKIHVFPFSVRAGTPAAKLKDRIQPKVIKQRAEILRKLSDDLGLKFREQFVGETCEVLLEDPGFADSAKHTLGAGTEPMSGRCERYFMVSLTTKTPRHKEKQNNLVSSGLSGKGDIVKVRITAVTEDGAEGKILIPPTDTK
ncbi:MAG: tRNA (N(6)-L-threonylcarbamoyladenosine(37)-C(2))-methylthiotransferase MtaB [Sedimentisphaerales bacterium]|jgi:threonylcarbamoyladenosine tRNA methylthiotransferase MtaB